MEPGDEEPHLFLGHDGDGDDEVGGGSGSGNGNGSGSGPRASRRDGRDDGKRQEDHIQVLTAAPLSLVDGNLSPIAIQTLSPMSALSGDEASLLYGEEEEIESPASHGKKRKRDTDLSTSPVDLLSDATATTAPTRQAGSPPTGTVSSRSDASSPPTPKPSAGAPASHNIDQESSAKSAPASESSAAASRIASPSRSHKRRRIDRGEPATEADEDKEDDVPEDDAGDENGDDADDEEDDGDKDDDGLVPDDGLGCDKDDDGLVPDVSDDLLARVYEKSHVLGACLWFADRKLGPTDVAELKEVFTTLGVEPGVESILACQELMRKIREWCTSDLRVLQRARSTATSQPDDGRGGSMSDDGESDGDKPSMPDASDGGGDGLPPSEGSASQKASRRILPKRYRKFNLPFKIQVLDYFNAHGRDRKLTAKEFGVEYHTVYGWTKAEAKLREQDARKRARYANGGYPHSATGRYPPPPSPSPRVVGSKRQQAKNDGDGASRSKSSRSSSSAGYPPPLERSTSSAAKPPRSPERVDKNEDNKHTPASSSSSASAPSQNSVTSAWHMHRDRKEQENDPEPNATKAAAAATTVTAPSHPPLSSISPPSPDQPQPSVSSQDASQTKPDEADSHIASYHRVGKKYRIFNIKHKIKVLDYFHATHEDRRLAAERFKVPAQTIYKWCKVESKLRARHTAMLAEEEHRAARARAKLARQSLKQAQEARRMLNRADELKYTPTSTSTAPAATANGDGGGAGASKSSSHGASAMSSTPKKHRGLSDVLAQSSSSSSAPSGGSGPNGVVGGGDGGGAKKRRIDPAVKSEPGAAPNSKRTPKRYKKFDDKFKLQALNWWHQNGGNRSRAAKQFGLEYHTFYAWTKQESQLRLAQTDRGAEVTIIDDASHGAESDPSEAPSSSESEQFDSDSGASDTSVSSASYDSGPERPFPMIPRARPRLTDIGPPKSLGAASATPPPAGGAKPFSANYPTTPGPSLASRMVMAAAGTSGTGSAAAVAAAASAPPTSPARSTSVTSAAGMAEKVAGAYGNKPHRSSSGKKRGRKRKAEVEAEWNSGNRDHLWECPHCQGHVYKKSKSTHLKYCRHRDTSPDRRGRRRTRDEDEKDATRFTPEYHPWATCRTVKTNDVDTNGVEMTMTTAWCNWCNKLGPRDFDGKKPKAFYRKPTPVSYLNKNGLNYIRWAKFRAHEDSAGHQKAQRLRAEKVRARARARAGVRGGEDVSAEYESESSGSAFDGGSGAGKDSYEENSDDEYRESVSAQNMPKNAPQERSLSPVAPRNALKPEVGSRAGASLPEVDAIKPPPEPEAETAPAAEKRERPAENEKPNGAAASSPSASQEEEEHRRESDVNERTEAIRAGHLSFIKRHSIEMPKPEDSEDDDDDDDDDEDDDPMEAKM